MAIADYLDEVDAAVNKQARDDLFNHVVDLERKLDLAEAYGKEGDMRMLEVLSELNTVDEDLQYYSKRANEPMPMRNYHLEVGKLIREYLGGILKRETDAMPQMFGGTAQEVSSAGERLEQLADIVNFYKDMYADLDLTVWGEKIKELQDRYFAA